MPAPGFMPVSVWTARVPRIARLMALGLRFHALIRSNTNGQVHAARTVVLHLPEIQVVTRALARQVTVDGMMKVVVPLSIEPVAAQVRRLQDSALCVRTSLGFTPSPFCT